jgi:hypothetical protein
MEIRTKLVKHFIVYVCIKYSQEFMMWSMFSAHLHTFGITVYLVKGLNHEEQGMEKWIEDCKFPILLVWVFWNIVQ